jgi:hypothetical protein
MHPGLTSMTAVKGVIGEMVMVPALAKAWASLSSKAQWDLLFELQDNLAMAYGDWCECETPKPDLKVVKPTPLYPLEPVQNQHEEEPEGDGA